MDLQWFKKKKKKNEELTHLEHTFLPVDMM